MWDPLNSAGLHEQCICRIRAKSAAKVPKWLREIRIHSSLKRSIILYEEKGQKTFL
jgi:hypothetical protein